MSKEYTHGIWIKRLKINLMKKDFGEEINRLKIRLSKMATNSGKDLHDFALEAVVRGLEVMEKEFQGITTDSKKDLDPEHKRLIALFEAKYEIARRQDLLNDLTPIYEDFGLEAFEEWCQENGFSSKEFFRLRKENLQKLSWSKQAKIWIQDQVRHLKSPMKVEDFLNLARSEGLIDESNESSFYQHISRLGFLNNPYGHVFDK